MQPHTPASLKWPTLANVLCVPVKACRDTKVSKCDVALAVPPLVLLFIYVVPGALVQAGAQVCRNTSSLPPSPTRDLIHTQTHSEVLK